MTSRWAAKLVIAIPITIIVILIARTYMRNRRIDYWTLAEGSNQQNDSNAQMRILLVGNSFIHYNGGAEKVLVFQKSASTCTSYSCQRSYDFAHPDIMPESAATMKCITQKHCLYSRDTAQDTIRVIISCLNAGRHDGHKTGMKDL